MSFIPYLIHLPLILFFVILIRRKYESDTFKEFYFPALILKISAGILLGLIYIYYYNGISDSLYLFERSNRLAGLFWTDPVALFKIYFFNSPYPLCVECNPDLIIGISIEKDPRTLLYVKLLSLFNVVTFNNFWITSVYLSFFSFLGFYFLANTIVKIYKVSRVPVGLSLLIFPSVLIWSSGVLKESFVMGSLTFLVSIVILCLFKIERLSIKNILSILVLSLIIFSLKYYYFAILIPVLMAYVLVKVIQERSNILNKSEWYQSVLFLLIFIAVILLVTRLHPNLSLDYFSEALINSYNAMIKMSHGKNVFHFEGIQPNFMSILGFMPEALSVGMFRPFIWETHNMLGLASAIENSLIFILMISSLVKLVVDLINKNPVKINLEFFALSLYVILLAFIIPIASANWGSLVRYKIGYFPFLILLITIKNPFIIYLSKKFKLHER